MAHVLSSRIDICAIKATGPDQVLMFLLARWSVITLRAHLGRLSRNCHAISEKQHSGDHKSLVMLCKIGKPMSGNSRCSSLSINSLLRRPDCVEVSVQQCSLFNGNRGAVDDDDNDDDAVYLLARNSLNWPWQTKGRGWCLTCRGS